MADSNSQSARCPCGFWGSAQTLGLCSKCYRERQQADSGSQNATSSSASSSNGASIASTMLSQTIASIAATGSSTNGENKLGVGSSPTTERKETAEKSEESVQSTSMPPPKEPSPGSKRDASEVDPPDPDQPVQKNKKRCFKCNCKLELAIREIGRCRCDYIFCQLHRLPEQHDCIFDHKEKGREEARNKMVSPKKHMGTTLKRIDSDS